MVTLVDHHDEPYITEQRRRCYFRRNEHCRISNPNFDIKAASTSINHLDLLDAGTLKFAAHVAWKPNLPAQRRTGNITQIGQTRDLAVALLDSDPITVAPPQHKF